VTNFYDPFQASASSVSTFELCHRKWAWRAIDGLEGPQSKQAEFGTSVHALVEDWLRARNPPVEGTPEHRVAQAIIAHLPPPQLVDPNNVEVGLSMRLGGVYFVGYIDLFVPEHPETRRPRVYDHKTTSDFGWALAPETMTDDVQATLYATWAFLKTKAPEVDLQWTYGLTRGAPKSLPVIRTVTGRDIKDRVSKTIDSAKTMREIVNMGVTAIEVPYDAAACEAFGGCPFIENCKLTAQERIESIMSQGTAQLSLLEQLRLKRNNNKQTAPATDKQPVNPPAATSTNVSPLEKLRQKKAAAPAPAVDSIPEPEPVEEEVAPAPVAAGPGRPKKVKAFVAPVVEPVVKPSLDLEPKAMWTLFVAAALVGGKDAEEAGSVAGDLLLQHAELFPPKE